MESVTHPTIAMLVTEEEARKMFFSAEARPSPRQMAMLRKTHHLPALRLGHRVLYWSEEIESCLKALQEDRAKG